MKMFLFKECFSLEQIDSTKLGSHLYMNQEMAETWTLNVVCSLKARLDMIYSSDRFIPLIHWYVSAAVYWYFTRQSFGYINCFVTDSFYIE